MRRNNGGLIKVISAFAVMAFPSLLPEPSFEPSFESRPNLKAEIYDSGIYKSFVGLRLQNADTTDIPAETEIAVYVFLDGKPGPGNLDYDTKTGLAYRGPLRVGGNFDVPRFFHFLYVAGIFDIEEKPDGRIVSTLPFEVSFGKVELVYKLDPGNVFQESDESDNVVRWEFPYNFIYKFNRDLNAVPEAMAKLLSLEKRIESN